MLSCPNNRLPPPHPQIHSPVKMTIICMLAVSSLSFLFLKLFLLSENGRGSRRDTCHERTLHTHRRLHSVVFAARRRARVCVKKLNEKRLASDQRQSKRRKTYQHAHEVVWRKKNLGDRDARVCLFFVCSDHVSLSSQTARA